MADQSQFLETCRECRDEGKEVPVPATVIIWGKLFPPEALGPKCDNHAPKHLGGDYYSDRLQQWAVFDLRGLTRTESLDYAAAIEANSEIVERLRHGDVDALPELIEAVTGVRVTQTV